MAGTLEGGLCGQDIFQKMLSPNMIWMFQLLSYWIGVVGQCLVD
jgi:hypothetical protein